MSERRDRAHATREILVERFPLAFMPRHAPKTPLKICIDLDIRKRCPDLSHARIRDALRSYTGGLRYLKAMVEGTPRINLDGLPSGKVDARADARARERVANMKPPKTTTEKADA